MPQEPFSRVVRIESVPKDGQTVTIEANPVERDALAAFLKVPSIESLEASFALTRAGSRGLRVSGSVHGELIQHCVVSLEPFPASVDEEVDVRFAPRSDDGGPRAAETESDSFSISDEDEPDPIVDGKIDLGVVAAEFFALGLDPYPRKPGVSFEPPRSPEDKTSPFSSLAARAGRRTD